MTLNIDQLGALFHQVIQKLLKGNGPKMAQLLK